MSICHNELQDSVDGGNQRAVLPFGPLMQPPDGDESTLFTQRYQEDFIQKKTIGKGGFGKVYQVNSFHLHV